MAYAADLKEVDTTLLRRINPVAWQIGIIIIFSMMGSQHAFADVEPAQWESNIDAGSQCIKNKEPEKALPYFDAGIDELANLAKNRSVARLTPEQHQKVQSLITGLLDLEAADTIKANEVSASNSVPFQPLLGHGGKGNLLTPQSLLKVDRPKIEALRKSQEKVRRTWLSRYQRFEAALQGLLGTRADLTARVRRLRVNEGQQLATIQKFEHFGDRLR